MNPAVFSSLEELNRVLAAVRKVESWSNTPGELYSPVESPTLGWSFVRVTGGELENYPNTYPAQFMFWNYNHPDGTNSFVDTEETCYVKGLNNQVLTVGMVYAGQVVELVREYPNDLYSTEFPVVLVVGESRCGRIWCGWVQGLETSDCLLATYEVPCGGRPTTTTTSTTTPGPTTSTTTASGPTTTSTSTSTTTRPPVVLTWDPDARDGKGWWSSVLHKTILSVCGGNFYVAFWKDEYQNPKAALLSLGNPKTIAYDLTLDGCDPNTAHFTGDGTGLCWPADKDTPPIQETFGLKISWIPTCPTTTSTTTGPACSAYTCRFDWSISQKKWIKSSSCGLDACSCSAPTFCPPDPNSAACVETPCLSQPNDQPVTINCTGTTSTTTSGPSTSTTTWAYPGGCPPTTSTTTAPCSSAPCQWFCRPGGLPPILLNPGTACSAGSCGFCTGCSLPDCTGVDSACEIVLTSCGPCPPPPPPRRGFCLGNCTWIGVTGDPTSNPPDYWVKISHECLSDNGNPPYPAYCTCDPPTNPPAICGEILTTGCYWHINTPGEPTSTTTRSACLPPILDPQTSTTTDQGPGPCGGFCILKALADLSGWSVVSSSGCTGCNCAVPGRLPSSTCEHMKVSCRPSGTTSSTTTNPPPTTTTTSTSTTTSPLYYCWFCEDLTPPVRCNIIGESPYCVKTSGPHTSYPCPTCPPAVYCWYCPPASISPEYPGGQVCAQSSPNVSCVYVDGPFLGTCTGCTGSGTTTSTTSTTTAGPTTTSTTTQAPYYCWECPGSFTCSQTQPGPGCVYALGPYSTLGACQAACVSPPTTTSTTTTPAPGG